MSRQHQSEERPRYEFMRRIKRNHRYIDRLLLTLELNKIEATYQDYKKPPIFRKTYDELGLVTRYEINHPYEGQLPKVRNQFEEVHRQFILEVLDDEANLSKLDVMLIAQQTESQLQKDRTDRPPIIAKDFDENGFPITYGMNPEANLSWVLIRRKRKSQPI